MYVHLQRWPLLLAFASALLLFYSGTANAKETVLEPQPSPALRALITETLQSNPGVLSVRAAVNAAAARVRGADQPLYNPELELAADQAETRTGTVGLSQAIDWADKRGARTGVASAELSAQRAAYDAARQKLVGELISALANYHTADAIHQLASQRMSLMQRFLDLAEQRQRAGDLSQVELNLAKLAHTQTVLQLSQATSNLSDARQSLVAVTGKTSLEWPALPSDIPELNAFDAASLLNELPELNVYKAQVNAARAAMELRNRERSADPKIGIRTGKEWIYRNNNDESFGATGLTLSVPLYVRNTFKAEVEAANEDLIQAQALLQERYLRVQSQLLSSAERFRLSRNAWNAWLSTGQSSISSQVTLLERIWQSGEMSTTDYLVQLQQALATRTDALSVQGRLWTAWADWLVSSGQMTTWLGEDNAQ